MGATFFSTVVNKVDQKGRVSIPAPFRAQLAAENPMMSNALFFPSFRLPAIEGSGVGRVAVFRRHLDRFAEFSDEYQSLQTLFAETYPLAIDPEGRVMLPSSMLEHANITDSITFVGAGPVFQMWEPSAYNEHKILMKQRKLDEHMTIPPVHPDDIGRGGRISEIEPSVLGVGA